MCLLKEDYVGFKTFKMRIFFDLFIGPLRPLTFHDVNLIHGFPVNPPLLKTLDIVHYEWINNASVALKKKYKIKKK